jgi:hypothetical protein
MAQFHRKFSVQEIVSFIYVLRFLRCSDSKIDYEKMCCHVYERLWMGFGLDIGFIDHLYTQDRDYILQISHTR